MSMSKKMLLIEEKKGLDEWLKQSKQPFIIIYRSFTMIVEDDHTASVVLSCLYYWQDKGRDSEGWIYKSYAEWYKETRLTIYQVKRVVRKLEKLGFLETGHEEGNNQIFYRLIFTNIKQAIFDAEEKEDLHKPIQVPRIVPRNKLIPPPESDAQGGIEGADIRNDEELTETYGTESHISETTKTTARNTPETTENTNVTKTIQGAENPKKECDSVLLVGASNDVLTDKEAIEPNAETKEQNSARIASQAIQQAKRSLHPAPEPKPSSLNYPALSKEQQDILKTQERLVREYGLDAFHKAEDCLPASFQRKNNLTAEKQIERLNWIEAYLQKRLFDGPEDRYDFDES